MLTHMLVAVAPSASGETGDCDSDMNYYMERLSVLRSRLNNTKPDHLPTSATMPSVASAGDLGSETFNIAYHKDRLKALRERAGSNTVENDVAAPTSSVDASSSNSSSSLSSESSATVGLALKRRLNPIFRMQIPQTYIHIRVATVS